LAYVSTWAETFPEIYGNSKQRLCTRIRKVPKDQKYQFFAHRNLGGSRVFTIAGFKSGRDFFINHDLSSWMTYAISSVIENKIDAEPKPVLFIADKIYLNRAKGYAS
jgi:hypothetical protein